MPNFFNSGSMGNPMTSNGQIIYGGDSGQALALAAGSSGQILQSKGTSAPIWINNAAAAKTCWAGFHANDASWARTNTAFGDPTADTTVTFTERANSGFGTVVSYKSGSDFLPGIVFKPSAGAYYYISATVQSFGPASATAGQGLRLFEVTGSTEISTAAWQTPTTSQEIEGHVVQGIYASAAGATATIAVQTRSATGAITITAVTAGVNAIEWSVLQIV